MFQGSMVRRLLVRALSLFPVLTYANVVWPALYLETRLFSWWAISIGLLIEFFFIGWLFSLSQKQAIIATVTANAVSAVAGIVLIPLAGIAWELFPGSIVNRAFGWGTFNPVTWVATFLLVIVSFRPEPVSYGELRHKGLAQELRAAISPVCPGFFVRFALSQVRFHSIEQQLWKLRIYLLHDLDVSCLQASCGSYLGRFCITLKMVRLRAQRLGFG